MIEFFNREKFSILLVVLLINVLAAPFFKGLMDMDLFFKATFSAVMLSAILTVTRRKKSLAILILLTVPCLIVIWFRFAGAEILLFQVILKALFDAYMVAVLILFIFEAPEVDRNVLSASIVVYLFLGLFFGNFYQILELTSPGSFSMPHDQLMAEPIMFQYFSFVTLTTLGYGDFTPVSPQAINIAILEATIGQLYIAVLIARLVGIYSAGQSRQRE